MGKFHICAKLKKLISANGKDFRGKSIAVFQCYQNVMICVRIEDIRTVITFFNNTKSNTLNATVVLIKIYQNRKPDYGLTFNKKAFKVALLMLTAICITKMNARRLEAFILTQVFCNT